MKQHTDCQIILECAIDVKKVDIPKTTIENYKKLNEKIDLIIEKIKKRKLVKEVA